MNPHILPDSLLESLLQEDAPFGDATTWGLEIGDAPGRMVFRARHPQVVCCSEEACRMGALRGLQPDGDFVRSGTAVEAGAELLRLRGRAASLHAVWKSAQTLMEYAGGIASAAAELVSAARRVNPALAVGCTRKNFPGTKAVAIKAILAGGAFPHRLGLSETLLLFAEHRAFLGDATPADAIDRLRRRFPERQVVVEVGTKEEALRWIDAGADVIQLEKCPPETAAEIVRQASGRRARISVAGGVNPRNVGAYAAAGVHILISSAPYFAPPRDIAVTIEADPPAA
jgi:molybdenum transport protein